MNSYWITKTPIAHRGLFGPDAPENSIGAIMSALRRKYAVELDIQLSRDGEVVVFHDWNLNRMTGIDANVDQLRADELAGLRLNGTEEGIPRLQRVLENVRGRVPLLIEIKNRGLPGRLEAKLCDLLDEYDGPCAVESFNPLSLYEVRKRSPKIMRGQLVSRFEDQKNMAAAGKFILTNMLLNRLTKPSFIACHLNLLEAVRTKRCRNRGLPILGWTVTNMADEMRARQLCDNVIFENIYI